MERWQSGLVDFLDLGIGGVGGVGMEGLDVLKAPVSSSTVLVPQYLQSVD